MTHSSPQTYLVWSTLSFLVASFLVYHLWSFDRFRCLRWNQGFNGGFKRLMTYTYITGLPLMLAYSVGFCIIKYSEGYIFIPGVGIIPTPYELWANSHRNAIFPLYLCISIAWGLEMVTHLQRLAQDWFRSWYFKTWAVGSLISVIYIPLVTIVTRSDPLKCEAFTFLAGSTGSLLLTICSMVVMPRFKPFLEGLRREQVDISVVIRLTKFQELSMIFIYSRALSAIPLLILSVGGVTSDHYVNESLFLTDMLQVMSGFGVAVSSAIALPIFFPRSIQGEIARADSLRRGKDRLSQVSDDSELYAMYDLHPQPSAEMDKTTPPSVEESLHMPPPYPQQEGNIQSLVPNFSTLPIRLEPNRRPPDVIEHERDFSMSAGHTAAHQPGYHLSGHRPSSMARLINSFRSPIDIGTRRS
ncbi:hypothetical protein F5148DRAFT_31504 [Russula earlei]|uniref:Uncharacterized protein n=1 Tax=Russula earlei TaxID=71964 RepID=A0ACC0U8M8_9AGAM|nr:hypothetical protein F5148DRAFT_31504 [Russula earlei]